MRATRIKLFGERNTNTNYLSQLIRLNLDIEELPGTVPTLLNRLGGRLPLIEPARDLYFRLTFQRNLGWKHAKVPPVEVLSGTSVARRHVIGFVTLTKNPYSWLLSLHRRPYHQRGGHRPDFERFLTTPWRTVGRENADPVLSSPVELWNVKNRSYLPLAGLGGLNITTEALFADPAGIIEPIAAEFDIPRRSRQFIDYEASTKNDPGKSGTVYRDYYLGEKWRDELSARAVGIINERVDRSLMTSFGYPLID